MGKRTYRGQAAIPKPAQDVPKERSRARSQAYLKNGARHASGRVPFYDSDRRELRVGEIVIKCFTQGSDAQEVILTTFQEENWARRIDDPLPGKEGQERKQRLRTAVTNLNRRQRVPVLRFHVIQ